jgi:hypothetical protein
MTKIKLIEYCEECQYKHTEVKGIINKSVEDVCIISGTGKGFCDFDSPRRKIIDTSGIPNWCPLEDAIPDITIRQREYRREIRLKKHFEKIGEPKTIEEIIKILKECDKFESKYRIKK